MRYSYSREISHLDRFDSQFFSRKSLNHYSVRRSATYGCSQ